MQTNQLQALNKQLKELKRESSIIRARLETEYDLPEELKHKLSVERNSVLEDVENLEKGGQSGQK